jgi:hypothetical protein
LKSIGFLGKLSTGAGVLIAGHEAIYGGTEEARNLGRQDLAFTGFGEAFPELAPFVTIPYAVGRAFRDFRQAAAEAAAEKLLEAASEGCN